MNLRIPHNSRSRPRKRIISLIPIHEALPPRNPRMGGPRTAQHDIMLPIKEISRVSRVQLHGLKPFVACERGTGPLPHAAHLTLADEVRASRCDGLGVPVAEADIGTREVDEEVGPGFIDGVGRWCFLYAVVDEVAGLLAGF